MASRVIQIDSADLPTLEKLGLRHKDVTARERHLKLTINRLKCDLAGDSARFFVVDRAKFAHLSRVATAARALPLDALAERNPAEAPALRALARALEPLGGKPARRRRRGVSP
jgi:hypothetical protein